MTKVSFTGRYDHVIRIDFREEVPFTSFTPIFTLKMGVKFRWMGREGSTFQVKGLIDPMEGVDPLWRLQRSGELEHG